MFKTASFKLHDPTRKKRTMLLYAMQTYHRTMAALIEACLADPEFFSRCKVTLKSGKERVIGRRIEKESRLLLKKLIPHGWPCEPLKDYLLSDVAASLMSYYELEQGGFQPSRPTLPSLEPPTEESIRAATADFVETVEYPLDSKAQKAIQELEAEGFKRRAERLRNTAQNRMVGKAAGAMLRKTEAALPRPIEFTRCEERGFILLEREGRFFLALRLFAKKSRYYAPRQFSGMADWKTKQPFTLKVPMLVFPIEMAREHHEMEFLKYGTPQSAKLICRRNEAGDQEFYVNVAFRFDPEPVQTETVLGIDRGWKKIAACTLIGMDRRLIQTDIDMEGSSFYALQKRHELRIAEAQRKGKKVGTRFKVRGRAADNALGEFANRLIDLALQEKAQIVLEKLNAASMNRFLLRSQVAKLQNALTYKAERVGLPKPIEVRAAFSSQTCTRCGHKDARNRPKKDEKGKQIQHVFCCVHCGYEANADQNASVFVALRGLHQIECRQKGSKDYYVFESFIEWLKSGRGGGA